MGTGVCHTDAYTLGGHDSEGVFPVILGHEGGGIVESVGEGVTKFVPGDHVVPLYIPQCYECNFCKNPKTNICQKIRVTQGKGLMPDGTTRFTCKGNFKICIIGIFIKSLIIFRETSIPFYGNINIFGIYCSC